MVLGLIGIFPGSFDPLTLGHQDLISRGSQLLDKLYVAVLDNKSKRYRFSKAEREEMLRVATASWPNVEVVSFSGLLVDFVKQMGADCVLRGLRNAVDYEYERDMALVNAKLGGVETLFLPTRQEYAMVSSSIVRERLEFGGDVSGFVPQEILPYLGSNK